MDEPSHAWPRFSVTYSNDELRTYNKLMAGPYARVQNRGTAFGLSLAAILAIGLAVLAVFKLRLIAASAVTPVLYAAYIAFIAGMLGYYFVMRAYFRRYLRTDRRGGTWNYSFDDAAMTYSSETMEIRMAWRALDAVEDLGKMVLLRFGVQGIAIPARVFGDDAARVAFVTAAAARIKAAAETAHA